jgi:putative endonuclease
MYYVYIIRSVPSGRLYKGFCSDLVRRLAEHNAGKTFSTKPFVPWELVYSEEIESYREAKAREKYFKTAAGRRFIKTQMKIQVPRPTE